MRSLFPSHAFAPQFHQLLCGVLCSVLTAPASAQCDGLYDWAVWDGFTGNSATGTIATDSGPVSVTMSANYDFASTGAIYGYGNLSGFDGAPDDGTVPQTNWAVGPNGETTMCFSETVTNPVLLLASLGAPNLSVTISFSSPYSVAYNGSGMTCPNDSTLIGQEGYAIIVFPGEFDCVTIYSTTPEFYTNITWGLNPPLFEVTTEEVSTTCGGSTWTASGGVSYAWSGGTDPDAATNTFTASGTYILTVTDALGCTVVTSVTVDVPPGTTTTSSLEATACESFDWNGDTYTESGTYTFETTNAEGCDSVATLILSINGTIVTEITTSACDSFEHAGEVLTESGTYTWEGVTANGCDSTAILHLTMLTTSSASTEVIACDSYTAPDGTVLGESGTYDALLVAANGCDSLLTIVLTLHFSEFTTEPRYTCDPTDTDTTTFTYTNIHGCDSLHHIVPVQYPDSVRAHASFLTDPEEVEIPDGAVAIDNTSTNADTYLWDFGDGSPAVSDSMPEHVYNTPGIYLITLVVSNALGCSDTATVPLLVFQDPLVFVPNCFTPDGDGHNEGFRVVFNSPGLLRDMELMIFDRWGEQLISISDPWEAWDGMYSGEPVQDGIYPWRLRFHMANDGRAREARGHVSVLR